MRFVPAALAAAACVALGSGASRRLTLRQQALNRWNGALLRMEGALRRGGDVKRALKEGAGEPALDALAQRMEENPALPPDSLLQSLPWDALLSASERDVLKDCLLKLFSPYLDQQTEALNYARSQWTPLVRKARAEREKDGKLYVSLGWLAGAALFILLC